jgi:hypothetical protein
MERPSKLAKAIQETDEKVGLILMLTNGTMIRLLPDDGSVKPLSNTKIEAEILYNRIPFSKILFMANLSLGLLSFLGLLYYYLKPTYFVTGKRRLLRITNLFFSIALYTTFLFHLSGYCLRWYIGGRIPLSNGYETMQFMALCILLLSCLLHRKCPITSPGYICPNST